MNEKTNSQTSNIKAKIGKEAVLSAKSNLADALNTTQEKYDQAVEKLMNKPNMTEADKKNMENVIKYLTEIKYNKVEYLERLDKLLNYTTDTIKIGKYYEIARQYPEGGNGVYNEETNKRYYSSISDVPTKEGFVPMDVAKLPIWLLSENATYYKNFRGSLVLPLILGLKQDGYIEADGSLYGKGKYGVFGLGGKEYYEFEYDNNFAQLRTINMDNSGVMYLQVKSNIQ